MGKEIRVPFKKQFKESMLNGSRTIIPHYKRYGEKGDYFYAYGQKFVLTDVVRERLGVVAEFYYRMSGLGSMGEFIKEWEKMHPIIESFRSSDWVWLHKFKKIDSNKKSTKMSSSRAESAFFFFGDMESHSRMRVLSETLSKKKKMRK